MLLEVAGLTAGYDDSLVLHEVSFGLEDGGSLALLGRNGMGKTTLLATLMGHTRQVAGTITFSGRDLSGVAPYQRARAGLGWVAQEREIFPSLSVEENLTVAARSGEWNLRAIYELFPRLEERRRSMGNQLSGGEQQMLAISRALMTNPKLILLDEPLEGLAPVIVEELIAVIRRMNRERGLATILVEQHAETALDLAEHALVLERGRVAWSGPAKDLRGDVETLDRLVGVRRR